MSAGRGQKPLAYTLLLAVVLVWGSTFVLVKQALAVCSPLLFNTLRMALATLALLVFNAGSLRGLTRNRLRRGALAGVLLAAGYQLQTLGLARTTPAKSGFVTGLVVVFVPLLTLIPRFRPASAPKPGWLTLAGAALAFAGLLLLTTPAGVSWRDSLASIGAGDLLTLGCAVAFAGHLLSLSGSATHMPAGVLATLQIGFATVVMLLTLPLEPMHIEATPLLAGALLITSLLGTAAAFTIQSFAQQHVAPAPTVLLLTLEPVFAWLTSVVVLHESLDRRALLGAGLILAAVLLLGLSRGSPAAEIPA